MTFAPHHDAHERRYGGYDERVEPGRLTLAVEPDERAGAPLPNRRRARLRRVFLGTMLMGIAWAAIATFGVDGIVASAKSLAEGLATKAEEIAADANRKADADAIAASGPPGLAASGALTPGSPDTGEPAPLLELAPPPAEPAAAAAEPVSTETLGAAYAEKAAPAVDAATDDPKRKSAIAAGLGPDLPNVLLTRLSKADLKNAAYAIRTALAKTPDDGTLAWPPKPSRGEALFEVRFVQGAPQGCRRYIVTVTKDRWASTSAALEKCSETHARTG